MTFILLDLIKNYFTMYYGMIEMIENWKDVIHKILKYVCTTKVIQGDPNQNLLFQLAL